MRLRVGSVLSGVWGVVDVDFCGEGAQACLCPASRRIVYMSRFREMTAQRSGDLQES